HKGCRQIVGKFGSQGFHIPDRKRRNSVNRLCPGRVVIENEDLVHLPMSRSVRRQACISTPLCIRAGFLSSSLKMVGASQSGSSVATEGFLLLPDARSFRASGNPPTSVREPRIVISLRVKPSPGNATLLPFLINPPSTTLPPAATRWGVD